MRGYKGFFLALLGVGIILFSYGLVYFLDVSSAILGLAIPIAFIMGGAGFVIHVKEVFRELSKRANKDKSQN